MIFFNRKISLFALVALVSFMGVAHAKEDAKKEAEQIVAKEETLEEEVDMEKVSEAFGHMIGKNLDSLGVKLDRAQVAKGMQDAALGKDSPIDDAVCMQKISKKQEENYQEIARENLGVANAFMEKNAEETGIIQVEKHKLHYKTKREGQGVIVEEHFSPMIAFTGSLLDGKVFFSSQEDELTPLDEMIPGLRKGIVGMKEGGKRTLYIHPDLGFGINGLLPPNSLLVFEIEVIKANTPAVDEEEDSLPSVESEELGKEIASSIKEAEGVTR